MTSKISIIGEFESEIRWIKITEPICPVWVESQHPAPSYVLAPKNILHNPGERPVIVWSSVGNVCFKEAVSQISNLQLTLNGKIYYGKPATIEENYEYVKTYKVELEDTELIALGEFTEVVSKMFPDKPTKLFSIREVDACGEKMCFRPFIGRIFDKNNHFLVVFHPKE